MSESLPKTENKSVRTVCPYCGVGCGMVLETDGKNVIKVTGDKNHPSNFGRLCTKGQTSAQALANSGRMESFSFVAPVAYLLELLVLWTDQSRVLTFGIAGVLGILAGSCAMALYTRTFRWEGFASVEDTANHIAGAVLMGFGGVTALGCTIGQGLTGISTLAVGSILTFASIVGGCVLAVRYQEWRIDRMEAAVA